VVWVEGDALVLDRSADGGTTWLSPTQILTGTGYLDQPTLAAGPDGVLHLAWVEMIYIQATEYHIGYARSLDGGATWVDRQYVGEIVGIAAGERAHPDIAADLGSSYVYLVWDAADGIPQVLVAVSDDAGVSWGAPERLSSGDAEAVEPAVAVDAEGLVYVVWQDALNDSDDIFYRFSADYGATWSVTGRVNDDDTAYRSATRPSSAATARMPPGPTSARPIGTSTRPGCGWFARRRCKASSSRGRPKPPSTSRCS
jgi:hypothetical protein